MKKYTTKVFVTSDDIVSLILALKQLARDIEAMETSEHATRYGLASTGEKWSYSASIQDTKEWDE